MYSLASLQCVDSLTYLFGFYFIETLWDCNFEKILYTNLFLRELLTWVKLMVIFFMYSAKLKCISEIGSGVVLSIS